MPRVSDSRRACRLPAWAIRAGISRAAGIVGVFVVVGRDDMSGYPCAAMIFRTPGWPKEATASTKATTNRRLRLMGATGWRCRRPCRQSRPGRGARSANATRSRRVRRPVRSARPHRRGKCHRANHFTCAAVAQMVRESSERRLVVHVGVGLEVIAGLLAVRSGSSPPTVAGNLFGEAGIRRARR